MQEIIKIPAGIVFLVLGIPIGNLLARWTNEELKAGQKWFKIIIFFSLIGSVVSLIFGNDALLFTFLFIMIVTSRSLKERKRGRKRKNFLKNKIICFKLISLLLFSFFLFCHVPGASF